MATKYLFIGGYPPMWVNLKFEADGFYWGQCMTPRTTAAKLLNRYITLNPRIDPWIFIFPETTSFGHLFMDKHKLLVLV